MELNHDRDATEPKNRADPGDRPDSADQGWMNPYSFNPIQLVTASPDPETDLGQEAPLTVPTDALTSVHRHLDGYLPVLASPHNGPGTPEAADRGRIITVVGEAGTGKTHLALDLGHRAQRRAGRDAHALYVNAGLSDTPFQELYSRFLNKVRPHDLREAVNRLYTDVVIKEMQASRMTERLALGLRRGELTADDVVGRFEMSRSVYEQQLEDDLTALLQDDRDFARVLVLFREPQLDHLIWSWLTGSAPDAVMDRGVTTQINSETLAIRAMGHLIRLLSVGGHGVFLMIDEAQLLLLGEHSPPDRARRQAGLRLLLDTLRSTGAFVTFCALPEFYDTVSEDVRQRLGPRILMSPFTVDETKEYVIRVNRHYPDATGTGPGDSLAPFDTEALEAVVEASHGFPRQVISLLAHGYQRWKLEDRPVTAETIWDAAREHVVPVSSRQIRESVIAVLHRLGLDFQADHPVSNDVRVDFWVTKPQSTLPAWGVTVSGPIEVDEDEHRFLAAGRALKHSGGAALLLVVNGDLSVDRRSRLTQALGVEPVVYVREELESVVEAVLSDAFQVTARTAFGEGTASQIVTGLELLDRRQSLTYDYLLQLTRHVEALRTTSENGLDALRLEIQHATVRTGAVEEDDETGDLPVDVERLFRSARTSVNQAAGVQRILSDAFLATAQRADAEQAIVAGVRTALRASDVTSAIGLVSVLSTLVETFRQSVTQWFHRWQDPIEDASPGSLRAICRNFDSIYEYLPLSKLRPLGEIATTSLVVQDKVAQSTSFLVNDSDVRRMLDRFGDRVFREMTRHTGAADQT